MGRQPRALGDMNTTPALDTVAGEALLRFSASNTNRIVGIIRTRSPLASVRTLLSSRTVFRFSIQTASTGPSTTIQTAWLVRAAFFHSCEKMPSVQSPVDASSLPNICGAVMDLGFIFHTDVLVPRRVSVLATASMAVDLPLLEGPTTMMPWRTIELSYSCRHLSAQSAWYVQPTSLHVSLRAAQKSEAEGGALSTRGKTSCMRAAKVRTSSETNLLTFMS